MINLHESMGQGRNRIRDPWICSQTRNRPLLRYFIEKYIYFIYSADNQKNGC